MAGRAIFYVSPGLRVTELFEGIQKCWKKNVMASIYKSIKAEFQKQNYKNFKIFHKYIVSKLYLYILLFDMVKDGNTPKIREHRAFMDPKTTRAGRRASTYIFTRII